MDRVQNIEIRERIRIDIDIVETIEGKMLKWYGHLKRMDDNCWQKKICACNPPKRRKRGRLEELGEMMMMKKRWRTEVYRRGNG
jgi:hypothetical protein